MYIRNHAQLKYIGFTFQFKYLFFYHLFGFVLFDIKYETVNL